MVIGDNKEDGWAFLFLNGRTRSMWASKWLSLSHPRTEKFPKVKSFQKVGTRKMRKMGDGIWAVAELGEESPRFTEKRSWIQDALGASFQVSVERASGVKEGTTLEEWGCNWFEVWMKMVSKLILSQVWKKPQKLVENLIFLKRSYLGLSTIPFILWWHSTPCMILYSLGFHPSQGAYMPHIRDMSFCLLSMGGLSQPQQFLEGIVTFLSWKYLKATKMSPKNIFCHGLLFL